MANKYTMVNLDKVQAVYNGNIETVRHNANLPNGSFINLGALATGEREAYVVGTPATASLTSEEVLLVASPEVVYAEPTYQIGDFINLANKEARAYHLTEGDVFTITNDGIDGTPAVGKYLVPQNASFKPVVANDLTGGTRLACKIIEVGTFGFDGNASTTVRVVKA